eukprot:m.180674 g.180674  ORF g.180674 m.180674 type:complete len:81 (-) comp14951_c0_seq5:166-408(-)
MDIVGPKDGEQFIALCFPTQALLARVHECDGPLGRSFVDGRIIAVGPKLTTNIAGSVHHHAPMDASFIVPVVRLADAKHQ